MASTPKTNATRSTEWDGFIARTRPRPLATNWSLHVPRKGMFEIEPLRSMSVAPHKPGHHIDCPCTSIDRAWNRS